MNKQPNPNDVLAFIHINGVLLLCPRLLYRRAFLSTKMPQKGMWIFTLTKTTSCQMKCKENGSLLLSPNLIQLLEQSWKMMCVVSPQCLLLF